MGSRSGGPPAGVGEGYTFDVELRKMPGMHMGMDVVLIHTTKGDRIMIETIAEGGMVATWNSHCREDVCMHPGDAILRVNDAQDNIWAMAAELQSGRDVTMTVQRGGAEDWAAPAWLDALPVPLQRTGRAPMLELPFRPPSPPPTQPLELLGLHGGSGPAGAGSKPPPDVDGEYSFDVLLVKPDGARLGVDVLPAKLAELGGLAVKRIAKGGVVDAWNQMNHEPLRFRVGDLIVAVNDLSNDLALMMGELRTQKELRLVVHRTLSSAQFEAVDAAQAPPGGLRIVPPGSAPGRPALADAPAPPETRLSARPVTGVALPVDLAPPPAGNPIYFQVEFDKHSGARLGIDVMLVSSAAFSGLVVERIADTGCMEVWNQGSRLPYRVQRGDYIVQVNGIASWQDVSMMARELARATGRIRLTVQRGLTAAAAGASGGAPMAPPPPTTLMLTSRDAAPLPKVAPDPPSGDLRWGSFGMFTVPRSGTSAAHTFAEEAQALAAATEAAALAGRRIKEFRPSTGRRDGRKADSPAGPPPAQLLHAVLGLNDVGLARVLSTLLEERPWLVLPVEEALRALKVQSLEDRARTLAMQLQ